MQAAISDVNVEVEGLRGHGWAIFSTSYRMSGNSRRGRVFQS
jgi:hypothetical protein